MDKVRVAPSVLSADFLRLGEDLASVKSADWIHYDVMDGHYVPNVSFGAEILKATKRGTDLPVDVHLMVTNPDEVFQGYLDAGADVLTFHVEAARHHLRVMDGIHAAGRLAGVAINPGTSMQALDSVLDYADVILVMSVNPGFGGQKFIEGTYRRLAQLDAMCRQHGVRPIVEVDGGVSQKNAEQLVAAGVRSLVAGSAVFGEKDREAAITAIREAGKLGLGKRA